MNKERERARGMRAVRWASPLQSEKTLSGLKREQMEVVINLLLAGGRCSR